MSPPRQGWVAGAASPEPGAALSRGLWESHLLVPSHLIKPGVGNGAGDTPPFPACSGMSQPRRSATSASKHVCASESPAPWAVHVPGPWAPPTSGGACPRPVGYSDLGWRVSPARRLLRPGAVCLLPVTPPSTGKDRHGGRRATGTPRAHASLWAPIVRPSY